ncbi:hypothetical protein Sdia_23580 [Streptomyces diastaticus subsp. diastaticus]|uniref:Uncharacterized protein n=1 Tax=Streptomyces diastaticus subsp. diastaticus TaxID=68040 RepID=A0ABQ1CML4_STRDI|nr:hypothetical protein Sdia_23580 [Streptomyces diastaticus subsp. diastaticus]
MWNPSRVDEPSPVSAGARSDGSGDPTGPCRARAPVADRYSPLGHMRVAGASLTHRPTRSTQQHTGGLYAEGGPARILHADGASARPSGQAPPSTLPAPTGRAP